MCDRVGIIRDGRLVRVAGVAELKDIKHHEVELTFPAAPPAEAFTQVTGVTHVELLPDGCTLRVTIQGDINPVIKRAAQYALVNFVSREPSLEDVFLRFYQNGSARNDTAGVVS